ncbi:hypothetical protein M514_02431 [Trichuris suis]|uniref:Uncharacterized protein n=1 Tax=Trichuris suis TaxID=68888 RepID=A0A085N5P7_9BILA|nr:hypothetical protein M513_02431 [Trichuris suis]KFD64793.1 hypothetical protein M514_02431 [Trichuris suis]
MVSLTEIAIAQKPPDHLTLDDHDGPPCRALSEIRTFLYERVAQPFCATYVLYADKSRELCED